MNERGAPRSFIVEIERGATGCSTGTLEFDLVFRKNMAHFADAFRYSLQGFKSCFKDELAFRQECALGVIHFALVFALPLEVWLRVVLSVLFGLLLATELLNTAIESVVNLASPAKCELAKKSKDCGSAAVMVLIVTLVACWAYAVVYCFWGE